MFINISQGDRGQKTLSTPCKTIFNTAIRLNIEVATETLFRFQETGTSSKPAKIIKACGKLSVTKLRVKNTQHLRLRRNLCYLLFKWVFFFHIMERFRIFFDGPFGKLNRNEKDAGRAIFLLVAIGKQIEECNPIDRFLLPRPHHPKIQTLALGSRNFFFPRNRSSKKKTHLKGWESRACFAHTKPIELNPEVLSNRLSLPALGIVS